MYDFDRKLHEELERERERDGEGVGDEAYLYQEKDAMVWVIPHDPIMMRRPCVHVDRHGG